MSQPVLVAFLNFLSALVWPAVLVWLIFRFRSQIERLLKHVSTAKIGGVELTLFQEAAPNANPPVPEAKVAISQIGLDGFFTAEGIRNIVSQILPKGETGKGALLFFDNQSQ